MLYIKSLFTLSKDYIVIKLSPSDYDQKYKEKAN